MTNYRIFLLSFVTVSWVFLCGLYQPDNIDMSSREKQKTEAELKVLETKNTDKVLETDQQKTKSNAPAVKVIPHKTKQTTTKTTGFRVSNKNHKEIENPLDLSVPYKDTENTGMENGEKAVVNNQETNIFAPETKKKPRSLELESGFLMSPEPEAEKLKSVDGAGIVIKIKP